MDAEGLNLKSGCFSLEVMMMNNWKSYYRTRSVASKFAASIGGQVIKAPHPAPEYGGMPVFWVVTDEACWVVTDEA